MSYGRLSKRPEHLQAGDPNDLGDAWVWRAMALPSRLHVVYHLSHQRSEKAAITFLAQLKTRAVFNFVRPHLSYPLPSAHAMGSRRGRTSHPLGRQSTELGNP